MEKMEKMSNSKMTQQDQVQAIYLAQANIFSFEASQPKSWVPLCDSTVPISILYDNTRSIYRIISVDAEIKEVVVNTTVIPELDFVKTTSKFGYWKDIASGRIFGIGFASEYEAEAFDECLKKVKQNIGPPSAKSCVNLIGHGQGQDLNRQRDANNNNVSGGGEKSRQGRHGQSRDGLQGEGDGPTATSNMKLPPLKMSNTTASFNSPGRPKKINWEDIEQLGPAVLSFLNNQNRQQPQPITAADNRPSTYKVDLPIIQGSSPSKTNNNHAAPTANASTSPKLTLDDHNRLITPAHQPMSSMAVHHPYPPHMSYSYYTPQQMSLPMIVPSENAPAPPQPQSLMPMAMTLPHHNYCYQGPGHGLTSSDNSPRGAMDSIERRELIEEMNRLKSENIKLSENLIESTCNAKKWELQVNAMRADNIQLVKTVTDLNGKIDALHNESREAKEQANRWKDHYHQAVASAKDKSKHLKDAEDKLQSASVDKVRIESVMKNLEEELKRQQQINKEQQSAVSTNAGQYTNKYFKELEEHYRKLLVDSKKRVEDALKKDNDRKNVLRGVDTLFTGAIQGLINIHGQIRQAYEQ